MVGVWWWFSGVFVVVCVYGCSGGGCGELFRTGGLDLVSVAVGLV